jgi:hypothetical protein
MWTLDEARKQAEADIKAGYLIRYAMRQTRDRGLIMEVEIAGSGWFPEPYWQEYADESLMGGSNDCLSDY